MKPGRPKGSKNSYKREHTKGNGIDDCANCLGSGYIQKVECIVCKGLGYRKRKSKSKWVERG